MYRPSPLRCAVPATNHEREPTHNPRTGRRRGEADQTGRVNQGAEGAASPAAEGAEAKTGTMTRVSVALLSIAVGAFCAPIAAWAAPPAYCALYAREYASAKIDSPVTTDDVAALERLQDQAYFRCLNADIEPPFPETSAYFGASMGDIAGDTSGGIGEGDVSVDDEPLPADVSTADTTASTTTADAAVAGGPGNATANWPQKKIAWCKAHYPHSFDTKTGMVITLDGVRKLCP